MSIIVKFIIRNIIEKKFRTFLILLSIVISSALFFASSAMSDTMVKMFIDRIKNFYGSSEIVILAKENSPSPFFTTYRATKYADHMEYIIGLVHGAATYTFNHDETVNINLVGADINDFQDMNPVVFIEQSNLYPFDSKKIIISENTASKYGFKLGDIIDLTINGGKHKFKIVGICLPTGVFSDDGSSTYGIVPRDTLSSMYNARGRVNMIGLKLKDPLEKEQMIKDLSMEYERYMVREPFSKEELKRETSQLTTSFLMMSIIVTIMSIFIIYTSFKVVTTERLPVIGTFRSVGATRKTTNLVLLIESTLYGVIGGSVGCVLGIGILYIMARLSTPVWQSGFKTTIEFTPIQLLSSFLFAVVLSFISCLLPIIQISKMPVKDIVLNNIEKVRKNKSWKLYLGLLLLIVAIAAPPLVPRQIALGVDILCIVFSITAVIILVPLLTKVFVRIFERLYVFIFGNVGSLAAKNLRDNKSIITNISLLAIGISGLLMINSVSSSVVTEVANFYRNATFDIWVLYMPEADRNIERSILQIEGVKEVYPVYSAQGVEVVNRDRYQIGSIEGVDRNKFSDFWNIDFVGSGEEMLKKLDGSRNIILTTALRDKFALSEGDIITLNTKNGNKDYKVVGFISTLRDNGNYALVSERFLKADMNIKFYSSIWVKTVKDPDEVLKALQKKFDRRHPSIRTVKQMEILNRQSNDNIFTILKGFSILTLIIGIFGVLNNLIISFIERKRSLAMLRSIGMNRLQIVNMVLIESLTAGFIGGTIGIITGFLLIHGVPNVMKAMDISIPIHYPFETLWIYLAAGIIITLTASTSPAIKTSKLNIIEAIKYE